MVFTFTVSGISWQAHVGGLIGGVVLGAAMVYAPRQHRSLVQWSATAAVLVISLVVVAVRCLALS
jgi:membrane associated rhomboid family serine protease